MGMEGEIAAEMVVDPVDEDGGLEVAAEAGAETVVDAPGEEVGGEAGVALEELRITVVRVVVVGLKPEPGLVDVPAAITTIVDTLIVVAFTIGSRLKAPELHASSNVFGDTSQL